MKRLAQCKQHMASVRACATGEETLKRQAQNKQHMASVRACATGEETLKRQTIQPPYPFTHPSYFTQLLPSACMSSEGTVVGSVCLSVTQHLTSPLFVRLTNDMTYLTGNEGQKMCAVFKARAVRLMRSRPYLSLRKMRMRIRYSTTWWKAAIFVLCVCLSGGYSIRTYLQPTTPMGFS